MRLFTFIFTFFTVSLCYSKESPLIIAVGDDSFPFQYENDLGHADGFLVEYWKAWSIATDKEVKFIVTSWPKSIELVKNGGADIHAGMAKTLSREKFFSFSDELTAVSTHLYVHHLAEHVKTANDLTGYTIGIVKGSAHKSLISNLIPDATYRVFDSRTKLLDAALKGKVLIFAGLDGYLRERSRLHDITSLFPYENRIKITSIPLKSAVLNKNKKLVNLINEGISKISTETLQAIKQKWLGFDNHIAGISVALNKSNQPFSEIGNNGIPHGLYVDLWRAWAQAANTKVNFVFYEGKQGLSSLIEGDIEVVVSNSSQRNDKRLLNAWKVNDVKHRLFLHDMKVSNIKELRNVKIGVVEGKSYIGKLRSQLNESQIITFSNLDEMLDACLSGTLSGFVAPGASTQHQLLINDVWSKFYQITEVEFNEPVYAIIKKGNNGLQRKLLRGFNKLPYNQISDIEKKWVLNPADQVHHVSDTILALSPNQIAYLETLPRLKIGYLNNWAPIEFQDNHGVFTGINADVVEHIQTHLKIDFLPVAFDNWTLLLEAFKSGHVDLIGSVSKSKLREEYIEFSNSYWPTSWAIVSRFEHAGLFSLNQLSNLKVALVEDYDVKEKLLSIQPSIKLIQVTDTKSGIEAVTDGDADIFINKLITLTTMMKNEGYYDLNLSLLPEISSQHSYFGVTPEHKDLIPLLNVALSQLDQTKKQEIFLKWVPGANLSEHYKYRRWMFYLSIILTFVVLSFATYWWTNKKLQTERVKRQKVEQRIQYLNTHDNLTGLLNRRLLDDRLTSAVLTHSREQTRFAVMFVGLDNFKLVNELKGYSDGDELLIAVANSLAGTIRRSDTLARFGSDEFVIILNRAQEFDAVCQVAENALVALNRVIDAQTPDVPVTASIGIAFYPMDADNPIELLKQADKLMQLAKKNQENSYMTS